MAAKAMAQGETFPCIDRFRGHGPLLQNHQRKRWFQSKRYLASTAFGGMAPSYKFTTSDAVVGAAHGRESDGSG